MNIQLPNSIEAVDLTSSVHPYTDLKHHAERGPHVITHGEGVRLYDSEGRAFVDGMAGLWCASLGYSETRLAEAAAKQFAAVPYSHSFAHRANEPTIRLAEALTALAPAQITRAFFVNSGSEAIDAAIQFIWYYNNAKGRPEKKKIIGRDRAYHGVTIAAGSLTALPYKQVGFDLPVSDRFLRVTCPNLYRYGHAGETEEQFVARLADEVEDLIVEQGPDTIAAFIAEPVQGAGGVIIPPRGYFAAVQERLRKYDVLLICDEVINGFGRTGNWWGSETMGAEPDMMCCAKQLSAAYLPIGATLMSEEIYQTLAEHSGTLGTLGIGMTYGGHPVCAAVALETLRIYKEDRILDHVREIAPVFQERLCDLGAHPLVGEARGVGLIGAVELVRDKDTREQFAPSLKAAPTVYAKGIERGIFCRPLPGDAVALCPPMIIGADDVHILFDSLKAALDDTAAQLRA